MTIEPLNGCCGVKELCDIGPDIRNYGPRNVMQQIHDHAHWRVSDEGCRYPFAAHLLFTSIGSYGQELAHYIEANKLGHVVRTPDEINPNSGSVLIAWLWTVDWDAFRAFVTREFGVVPADYNEPDDDEDSDDCVRERNESNW